MSLSPAKRDSIEEAIQDFRKVLHSSLPLRHISQFYEDEKIREATIHVTENILKKFMEANPNLYTDLLKEGLQNEIDEFLEKNEDHKSQSESFFKKQVHLICENFKLSSTAKLEINPDMDLKSMKEMIESGKKLEMTYFEKKWNLGNVGLCEKLKMELKDKLDQLGKEMFESHNRHLESVEAEKMFNEVKAIVLEMSRQLKHYVDTHEGKVPKQVLKERAQNIHDYLEGKGSVLNEKFEKIWSKLIGTVKAAVTVLNKEGKRMLTEDLIDFAERLDTRLKHLCSISVPGALASEQRIAGQELTSNQPALSVSDEEVIMEAEHEPDTMSSSEVSVVFETYRNIDGPGATHVEESSGDQSECVIQEMRNESDRTSSNEINGIEDEDVTSGSASEVSHPKTVQQTESPETMDTDLGLGIGVKRHRQDDLEESRAVVTRPPSKRSRQVTPNNLNEGRAKNLCDDSAYELIPDGFHVPLFRAIEQGQSIKQIEKLLERNGVNFWVKHYGNRHNAAHEVIWALAHEKLKTEDALAILNLLMDNGFSLIDDGSFTPLHLAMESEDLDEKLLLWFSEKGANFDAVWDYNGDSVLLQAIYMEQGDRVLRKIVEFGGDPGRVNKCNQNVLHRSAMYAHDSALKMFIDQLDVNATDEDGCTPLHYLFTLEDSDYSSCLEMLLKKGADFTVKNKNGHIPLVNWMKYGEENPFPVLMKLKGELPITQEIASATLTFIVENLDESLKDFLPQKAQNQFFTEFITFLIREKNGKLQLKDESEWNLQNLGALGRFVLNKNFLRELRTTSRMKLKGEIIRIDATVLGKFDLHTESRRVAVPMETVIVCLLACRMYTGFVKACQLLDYFCDFI